MGGVLIPCMSGLVYHGADRRPISGAVCLNPLYVGSRLSLLPRAEGLLREGLNPLYVGSRLSQQLKKKADKLAES